MRIVLKTLLGLLGLGVALIALVVVAGLFIPREHRLSRRVHFKATPPVVWAILTAHARDPEWRSDVQATVRLPDRNGHPVWQDQFKDGQKISYETTESLPERRLVRVIIDTGGAPFGGTWTFTLEPAAEGSRLTLTEDGWTGVPFRFLAKHVLGYAATVDRYLQALGQHLGETVQPEEA